METLFSNQYATIFLHGKSPKTLELQWLDFTPSAAFRTVLQEVVRLAQQHHIKALIADNRLIRALRPADLAWSGEFVLKGLSELGSRRFAVVESLDAMNRMGVTSMVSSVVPNTHLASQFFSTIEEARAWATQPV